MAGVPTLTKDGDKLVIDLSPAKGYDFRDALDKVRELPGRQFDYDTKLWTVEAKPDVAERILRLLKPEADDDLREWVRSERTTQAEDLVTPIPSDSDSLLVPWASERQPWQPEEVNEEPFNGLLPYQRAAVDAIVNAKRALCADDMGLGKTFQGISAVEEFVLRNPRPDGLPREGPRLVIAPNSVKGGWARELKRWLKDPPLQMVDAASPKSRHEQIQRGILDNAWVIVNWEQLRVKAEKVPVKHRSGGTGTRKVMLMKEPLFEFPAAAEWGLSLDEWTWKEHAKAKRDGMQKGWLAELADEIHRAKNKDAQQTQGLHRTSADLMVGFTGTPVQNSPDEMWALLHWLYPMEYTSFWDFFYKYVDYYEDPSGYGRVITGVKNPDALRFELRGRLIRRTAAILGLKGRKRIYYTIQMNPAQKKLYDEAEVAMWLEIETDINHLKQARAAWREATSNPKVPQEERDAAERAFKAAERRAAEAAKFVESAAEGATASTLLRIPNGAARMVRLQQIIENPRLVGGPDDSAIMDDIEEKVIDSVPETWVVGFKFRESCDIMAERLRKKKIRVGVYTGAVDPADRTKIEDAFQNGELDVIVGTVAALKEGITLTNGHLMYQATEDHVPSTNEQFESRRDRLGQQELVIIYKPLTANSVATDKVQPNLRTKEAIVRAVIPKIEIEEDVSNA